MDNDRCSYDDRYGLIRDAAVLIEDGCILWLGKETDLPGNVKADQEIDGYGQWLTPGLIDCHTHLIYAGDRSKEFEQRLEGVSYEEIARNGGGILSTVNATRAATEDELVEAARPRLEALLAEGVTTVEVKSGYGLDLQTELKMLRAAGRLADEYPVTFKRTFLGAHALPPEFKGRADEYIDEVCNVMLPAVAEEKLAEAVDVFCENIAFSTEQAERVFQKARELGFAVKLHAEQLSDSGGTELTVKYQGLSVDHLEYLGEQGIEALKDSDTVATLLPGAFYYLRETKLPPVEALREAGVPMAISTDLNPGTSPLASVRLMMNMACTLFRLTPSEALAGCTRNAAQALGLKNSTGVIKEGFAADLVLWPVAHPAALAASLNGVQPSFILRQGNLVNISDDLSVKKNFIWNGRIDEELNPDAALRWHQKVQPCSDPCEAGTALIGFASDEGVRRNKGRVGAAQSPDVIRSGLANLPWNSEAPVWDAGNVFCANSDLEQAQSTYGQRVSELLAAGHRPVGLGGGHEIAWGSYQGIMTFLETLPDKKSVGIINLDAHFDLRLPETAGASSGTPFWQCAEYAKEHHHPFHYLCLGVSEASNTRALFDRADELGAVYKTDREMTLTNLENLSNVVQWFLEKVNYIYLTIDMDAFPAGQAPGVSAPAVRGIPLEVAEPLLLQIKDSGKMLMMDVAEVNPQFDRDSLTSRLAARLIHLMV
ncbi:imidazolonepropionase [Sansalvadorimonas verongulae]|uniref:imidazolonepropionase n=1 Tax=Sansalvadorimonas verongulae TaxID=2172824 RepID=UPI001E511B97|nr:imidazolonepropionase [Sansalvadorimonas verongulae]